MTVSVGVRAPSARRDGAVVIQCGGGPEVALSAYEARELQRRILSAAIDLERGGREVTARAKTAEQRQLRRSSVVDEQLREREA